MCGDCFRSRNRAIFGAAQSARSCDGARQAGEAERCSQKLATLVEHAAKLLDHVVRPPEHRRRDCEAERLGSLQVDDEFETRRL